MFVSDLDIYGIMHLVKYPLEAYIISISANSNWNVRVNG